MLFAIMSSPFFQMALWACLLAAIPSGVIGTFVTVKRITFIAGSLSHSILGGIGFSLWLQKRFGIAWISPVTGAFIAAILSALLLGWIHLRYREKEDALIGAIWAMGMAIGVIFISITPGTNAELSHYLFGNILWIEKSDLFRLGGLSLFLSASVFFLFKKLLAFSFDEEQARLQGVSTQNLYLFLLLSIGLSVVMLMQVIGTILVIAMLSIPASIARIFTDKLSFQIFFAIFFSAFLSIFGLFTSYFLDWPPGASIALFAGIFYLASLPLKGKTLPFKRLPIHRSLSR